MIIKNISFLNIRKKKNFNTTFSPNTTIILGKNGSGKTTILEAIYFLTTTKSFRKHYNKTLITCGEKELKIKGEFDFPNEIKIEYKNKIKKIFINKEKIKKTSEVLLKTNIVALSPEGINIIECYQQEKLKQFDKKIFKIKPNHIQTIKKYNKTLKQRNALLEERQPTNHWDKKLAELGISVWKEREEYFKTFIPQNKKTQKKLNNKNKYNIEYKTNKTQNTKKYLNYLKQNTQYPTKFGPHTDKIEFTINNKNLKENGSQGEKKLFQYLIKLTESEILLITKKTPPIILLDDFFAKLDNENIMKIFSFFHRKFQTIITTTENNKKYKKDKEIKTIDISD